MKGNEKSYNGEDSRNVYKIPEWNNLLWRYRRRWKDNIKTDLKKLEMNS